MQTNDVLFDEESPQTDADALPGIRYGISMGVLFGVLILAIVFSLCVGRYAMTFPQLWNAIHDILPGSYRGHLTAAENVLFNIRFTRICAALMVGAALSLAGTAFQGLFLNPMVSPDILGASSGAGFGAAAAIMLSTGLVGMELSGFFVSVCAVGVSYLLYRIVDRGRGMVLVLVLTGMVTQSVFLALTTIVKYMANAESQLPAISFWLLGSLNTISWKEVGIMSVALVVGGVPLYLIRYRINALSFGNEEAQAMGVNIKFMRWVVVGCSTLMTAAAVSISGMIGWVGLVIPHISRLIVGPDYRKVVPVSTLVGAIFLLLVDDIARNVFVTEIPLGILTAVIGAPFFLYLLLRKH